MYRHIVTLGALLGAAAPTALSAQIDTPAQIVCRMTGECGEGGPDASQQLARPKTAGLSFRSTKAATPAAATPEPAYKSTGVTMRPRARTQPVVSAERKSGGGRATQAVIRADQMRVTFATGSAELVGTSRQLLTNYAIALKTSPTLAKAKFRVEGHTDAEGDNESNLKLSRERAEAVAAFLRAQGVESSRIEAQGFGEERLANKQAPVSQANRRVELVPIG
jgi:OmpA-OmpF porin, OOP family